MRALGLVLFGAGLALTAPYAQPAVAGPQTIEDLLARDTAVPLPPRRPADDTATIAASTTALPAAPYSLAPQAAPALGTSAQVQTAIALPARAAKPETARRAPAASLSSADLKTFRSAVLALKKGDLATTARLQNEISDSVAKAAIEWLIVRNAPGFGGAARGQAFLQRHPGWPSRDRIRRNIEATLFNTPGDPGQVAGYFAAHPPLSGEGEIAHGRALVRTGQKANGMAYIRKAWYTHPFTAGEERAILKEFGKHLKRADHLARAQGMLYRDRIKSAERLSTHLSSAENKMVSAWAKVIRRQRGAGAALKGVPAGARKTPGYQFAKIQYTRRAGDSVAAARLMAKAPRDARLLVDTGEWWTERRVLLRQMLNAGQHELAYRMAADHASTEPADIIAAEWHAGWVALSYLKRPRDAAKHFARMTQFAETPISVARANYWLGRATAGGGDRTGARAYYAKAAQHITTYYGQLAAEEIGIARVDLGQIAKSTRAVDALEPMRAATLFKQAGHESYAMSLIVGMSFYVTDGPAFARLSVLARELGSPHIAVNIAKRGMRAGANVADEAYPLSTMPNRGRNKSGTPQAFVYAIARQESEFNRGAVSSAGARGLMQLMPATARSMSRETGLKYSRAKLTSDPNYNMTLGSAYLAKRLDNFNGSYIMAAAAYNAGKSRVDRWIEEFGDPRKRGVDPIDWVERIPFSETRNYVMRVMENMQVYEARLSGNSAPLDIKKDLKKGR